MHRIKKAFELSPRVVHNIHAAPIITRLLNRPSLQAHVTWQLDPHVYKSVFAAVQHDSRLEWGVHASHLHYMQPSNEPSRLPAGCSHAVAKLKEGVEAMKWDMSQVKVAVDLGAVTLCL